MVKGCSQSLRKPGTQRGLKARGECDILDEVDISSLYMWGGEGAVVNLKTHIKSELWLAISNTYEAGNYTHAVLDSMHYLSNVLREKAGVDGDGVALVGQALGGDSPRLRVNKLQTETERNIQKGLEQILRGLFQAIRNPRSHEQIEDDKNTTDAIIFFIDYLLGILAESEEPFTIPKFLLRVFDPDFVKSDRYAQLLAEEIPENKRLDTLIEIYRKKCDGDGEKLKYIVNVILQRLTYDQTTEFLAVVSDELRTTQDSTAIRITLQILPPYLWVRVDEAARLRVENRLIESIREAEYDPESEMGPLIGSDLPSQTRDFLPHLTLLQEELRETLMEKLESKSRYERDYVASYFMSVLPALFVTKSQRWNCILAIRRAVKAEKSEILERRLLDFLHDCPKEWRDGIVEEFKDVTNPETPLYYLADGTPFLSHYMTYGDEIPF